MITINDYTAHKGLVCIDCIFEEPFAPKMTAANEYAEHIVFSRRMCDFCGSFEPGERFGGTYLTVETTIRGEES